MSGKRKRNPILFFVSVFAMLAMGSPASAYVVNTTSTGAEIKWPVPSPSYVLNTADGPAGTLEAVQTALRTWSEVPASSFVFTFAGTTTSTSHGVNDGQNIVTFAPMGATGTLAQNLYWYNTTTGEIGDSDIRFNTTYPWSTLGSSGYYDVQNIAAHELGHSLSLDNLYDSADSEKTMYGYSSVGETKKRSLDPDDVAGIAYLYPMSQVPDIFVAPDAIPFPDVIVLHSSTPREVAISNTGGAVLSVSGITLTTGTNYSVAPGGSNPCPSLAPAIGAGGNCTVEVTFRPTVVGTNISDTLAIASDDPDSPRVTVALSGNGVSAPAPNISVAPASIAFDDVVVFDSSSPQVATISNTGSARLNVSGISLDDETNFLLDLDGGLNGCGTATPSIEAGANCTVSVTFRPQSEASFSASLTVVSDDPDTVAMPLSGNGVAALTPNLSVAPDAIEFHDVLYGESSTPQEVTISNTGTAELGITEIALAIDTDYSVAEGGSRACSSLTPAIAAGDNCTIRVTFTPGSVANRITDTLEIASDDPPMRATVALSGNGVAVPAPKIEVDPVAIVFGDVLVETSSTQAVKIFNAGTADLVIEYIRLAVTTASAYSAAPGGSRPCDSMTPTIGAGNYCTVEVTFTPVTVGNDITGTLEIQPAGISGATVSLTGNGSEDIGNNPQTQSSGCGCRIVGNNDSVSTRAASACILMLPLLWIALAKRFLRRRK